MKLELGVGSLKNSEQLEIVSMALSDGLKKNEKKSLLSLLHHVNEL